MLRPVRLICAVTGIALQATAGPAQVAGSAATGPRLAPVDVQAASPAPAVITAPPAPSIAPPATAPMIVEVPLRDGGSFNRRWVDQALTASDAMRPTDGMAASPCPPGQRELGSGQCLATLGPPPSTVPDWSGTGIGQTDGKHSDERGFSLPKPSRQAQPPAATAAPTRPTYGGGGYGAGSGDRAGAGGGGFLGGGGLGAAGGSGIFGGLLGASGMGAPLGKLPTAPPSTRQLTPSRAYLRAADIPPKGVGAYGIVALSAKPTAASRGRLMRLCTAFVTHLPRQDSLPASIAVSDQMVTVWPLAQPDALGARIDNCGYVTENYDLYAGQSAITDANRQGAGLDGRGPFLIGWSPSSARGVRDRVVLVYDMSAYESQDSFDRAFTAWQRGVIENPALWRNGWSIEKIRLAIRDFLDDKAEAALKAINIFSGGDK